MADQTVCPACKEFINASAVKCKHCLEFLPELDKSKKRPQIPLELSKALIELSSKALTPLAIVILALVFKPTVETLLYNMHEAEFLGAKAKFSIPDFLNTELQFSNSPYSSFTGELTPLGFYYLFGSANGTFYNYDVIEKNGFSDSIDMLENKGLVEITIESNPEEDHEDYGKKTLGIFPTEKGKKLLMELGLNQKEDGSFYAP